LRFKPIVHISVSELQDQANSPKEHKQQNLCKTICRTFLLSLTFSFGTFYNKVFERENKNYKKNKSVHPEEYIANPIHLSRVPAVSTEDLVGAVLEIRNLVTLFVILVTTYVQFIHFYN